ncbi:MAG: 3-hydroxyacyl-thioester dehydratase HtdY [Acidimicrobiales bacterium]|nr:MAG: 3-hydroxyacyl-thioester dehydratase HtdY [Acidimicrobiales bacterium]
MPIDPNAVGTRSEPVEHSWTPKDCMLYALGVGAGVDELQFTTENTSGVPLRVLPTMAVVLGTGGFSAMSKVGTFNPAMLVHGEQGIRLHGAIPPEGTVETTGEITAIYDKGKGAVVELVSRSVLQSTGELLFENRFQAYIRGEGGFGGDRGPSGGPPPPPDREPDHEVTYETLPQQALLYRLSGDRNPLHSDPNFARMAGFDRPILHGLCTFGFTGRALLHTLCDSDPSRFLGMDGRFTAPVWPGESLTVRMWVDGNSCHFQTTATGYGEPGRVVIDGGRFTFSG